MIIRWRIKSRDCSIELLMVCWQNDIAQICQNGLRRCCLVEEHAPQRSVPHNAAFWGVFYNRSSAVVVNASMSRGRRANPVLTYETALRRFFCDTSRRVGRSDDDGGRWGEATADGGEVAYLRHAEVGVEENPGTLRCALHTGLRKSAVALRRESAHRVMTFIQLLFGGRCECIDVTG